MPLISKAAGCTLAAGGPSTYSCWASFLGGLSQDEEAEYPETWPNDFVLAEYFPRRSRSQGRASRQALKEFDHQHLALA